MLQNLGGANFVTLNLSVVKICVANLVTLNLRLETSKTRAVHRAGPQKALRGGIPGSLLEPLVRSWSHFVGIYGQKLTKSSKMTFDSGFEGPCVVTAKQLFLNRVLYLL